MITSIYHRRDFFFTVIRNGQEAGPTGLRIERTRPEATNST